MNSEKFVRIGFLSLAGIALVRLVANNYGEPSQKNNVAEVVSAERGKYLVEFGGCHDCHTPKKMTAHGPTDDLSRAFSGHPEEAKLPPPPATQNTPWFASTAGSTAWSGPWGISYASNLTPDKNTGLGIWTEEMFVKAMRTGKHMGDGRSILPPMPWEAVRKLTDTDLKSVFAYLRTLPAVSNRVPEPVGPDGKSFE